MTSNPFQDTTTIHPLGLAAIILLGFALFKSPRQYAIWPYIAMAVFIAPSQRIVLLGADFTLLRLMILFGLIRITTTNEWRGIRWCSLDSCIVAWMITGSIAYILLHQSFAAVVFKLGTMAECLGAYFTFRALLRDWRDLYCISWIFVIISIPVVVFFLIERATGRNVFSIFGGIPEITAVRDGRLRCRGAFAHAILAGCFWAAVAPWIIALWKQRQYPRWAVAIGFTSAMLIILLCNSATPVMAILFGFFGWAMFGLRSHMRLVRWSIAFAIIILHFAMEGPVWSLIGRMDLIGGTGWHRYFLIDNAIRRFHEWWLVGTTTTAHWGHQQFDITNQYVLEGLRGGIVTLGLFIAVISIAFAYVGRCRLAVRHDRSREIFVWAIGVSLFVHITSFIGVSYFGQINILWYLTLAVSGTLPSLMYRERTSQSLALHQSNLVIAPASGMVC